MSLLEEIQNEAVDSNSDLGALLRKCKVLAARLGSQPLEDWLLWESNGYPDYVDVPKYRIWSLELKGNFSGSHGMTSNGAHIPLVFLPEIEREEYNSYKCRASVSAIEKMLEENKNGIHTLYTNDLSLFLNDKISDGWYCVNAWAECGSIDFIELLNTVRNKILDFSLAIWKENKDAGNSSLKEGKEVEPSTVTQIFNTTIHGGSANLVGAVSEYQITYYVRTNDIDSLEHALRKRHVSDEDITELKTAIQQEPSPSSEGRFGPKVSAWLSKMYGKACEGSWSISIGVAGRLLADAISRYYGIY